MLVPISDHLFRIDGENKGRFPRSHAFYVKDDICALIDSGCGIALLEAFKKECPVDLVINSHCHPDHSAGNWIFEDRPLWVPDDGTDSHGRMIPLSRRLAEPGPLTDTWYAFVREAMGFREKVPTNRYAEGHVFDFGRLQLTALHTPGHTSDHFCFFDPVRGLLLSFDIDLTPFGPWYGNRDSDLAAFRASLQRVRGLGPGIIASSHREKVSGKDVLAELNRFEAIFDTRSKKILGLLSERPRRVTDLIEGSPFYGGYPYASDLLRYWEGLMIRKHLDELINQGLVWEEGTVIGVV